MKTVKFIHQQVETMQTSLVLLDELIERLHLDLWVELFLKKDDNMMKSVAIQALLQRIEAKHKEERNALIQQLADSDILILLINHLAVCDVGYVSSITIASIVNIIRIIIQSKNKCISIMIERLICFTSNYTAPTLGIMHGLYQLSWTHHHKIRGKIINEKMLNYLLHHFTIDSIYNDNESLLQIKASLLWLHIHFELSVKGSFIQKKAKQIANILDILINIDNQYILYKTCQSFKKFGKKFPMLISRKSLKRICNLLTSNTIHIAQESLRCLNGIVCQLNIDSFMQQNVLQKISNASSVIFKHSEISRISCELIGNLLLFSQSEYVVHCIIKYNLIKPIMNVIENEKFKRFALEIIWDILNLGNEQHIYFMIINENIMQYLCDQRLYKELKDINTDNVVLSVFAKLLFYGDKIKKMNDDKNRIAFLMKNYKGFELIKQIISKKTEIRDDDDYNRLLLSYYDKVKDQDIDYNDNVSLYDLEMIIIYFSRKYCEMDNNPLRIIPKSLQNMIEKFVCIKCNLSVSYLQMELDVNNLVFINRNKQCNYCENIQINIQRCSGCKYVFYCSKQCQRKHWKLHKGLCRQIRNYIVE